MHVHLLCISDNDKHFSSAIEEYVKRLGKGCIIQHIKPVKHGTREQIIHKETLSMQEKLAHKQYQDSFRILLEKDGKQIHTEEFSRIIQHNRSVVFVIGGPYGLDADMLSGQVDQIISFGKQTMPHGLAKLVLLEQIYRSSMIAENRTYHY